MGWDPCSSHSIFPTGIWVEKQGILGLEKAHPGNLGMAAAPLFLGTSLLGILSFSRDFLSSLGLKTCLGWAGLDPAFPPWNLTGKPGFGVVPAAPSGAGIPELLDFIPDPNPGWKSRKRVRIRPGILSLESLWGPGSASGMIRE